MRFPALFVCTLAFANSIAANPRFQGAGVASEAKISATSGGFSSALAPLGNFGRGVAALGDLDGDGMREIAVGAASSGSGAFWILFLNPDLTVRAEQKIDETQGGFNGSLSSAAQFGVALLPLGDRDADGFEDLVVGAPNGQNTIYLLGLNRDGTVRSQLAIGPGLGGFGGALGGSDDFGESLASIGDLDGDGVLDLAVGAPTTREGSSSEGAAWILFMNADGTVKAEQKLSATQGGLSDPPLGDDSFGSALAFLGDLDGDGAPELAIGAEQDDEVSFDDGSVWIVSLNPDGSAKRDTKISGVSGGFMGPVEASDRIGYSLSFLGDADADGFPDLAVGAHLDDDGGSGRGAFYILGLHPDGSVAVESKISNTQGGFEGLLNGNDQFGSALAFAGDLNKDGFPEMLVGAQRDDDGPDAFIDRGALWILSLAERGTSSIANGIGINPLCLSTAAAPALNSVWIGAVDATANSNAQLTILAGRDRTLSPGIVIGSGELLVDLFNGSFIFDVFITSLGGTDFGTVFVPDDLSTLGFAFTAQAAVLGGGSGVLCNALELVVGA